MSELFRQLVSYNDSRSATAAEIAAVIEMWSRELRTQVGSISGKDYLAAQKFLTGLRYTAESLAEAS
jgi:hypothetical protein